MLGDTQLGLHGQMMAVKSTGPQEEAREREVMTSGMADNPKKKCIAY